MADTRLLVDGTNAHHSGILMDYLGFLPALDARVEGEELRVLLSPELARALDGRIHRLQVEEVATGEGLSRVAALNLGIRARVRDAAPDVAAFGQYAPMGLRTPYVIRMTDAHLTAHAERQRLMRFYSVAERVSWRVKLATFRHSVERAGAVLVATYAARDELLAGYPGVDPPRVHVAQFGLSPVADTSKRHPGPRGTRLLTMHLSPRKNVEAVLDAMARPGMEAFELSVLGDLDRPTNRYTRFLAERARELGVEDRLHSLGYIDGATRLRQVILDHDVLLCPSRIESWSHTVVEGLALGIPVVASTLPAIERFRTARPGWWAATTRRVSPQRSGRQPEAGASFGSVSIGASRWSGGTTGAHTRRGFCECSDPSRNSAASVVVGTSHLD